MSGEIRPVAVTGIGIRSPLGASAPEHWAGIVAGTRAVRQLDPLSVSSPAISARGWTSWAAAPSRDPGLVGDVVGLATSAADEALQHAGLFGGAGHRLGVVFGASKPVLSLEPGELIDGWRSSAFCDPARFFALSCPAQAIANLSTAGGPLLTPSAACATGLLSVIRGAELIRQGDCDVVVAGSADSSLHSAYLAAYRRMGVLAPTGDDPGRSCRPFDQRRAGFAVGEGAAAIVLEDLDHARRRDAPVFAELLGAGLTSDNGSLVDVAPSGASLARALRDALARSHVSVEEIDAASLHGTGTRLNDLAETAALKTALGARARDVSCFSLKGAIGHLMGAAGSVEVATLIQAIQHGLVPPTVNLEEPDPQCDLDYTPGQARPRPIRAAIKLSLGFGGTCAALVVRRPGTT